MWRLMLLTTAEGKKTPGGTKLGPRARAEVIIKLKLKARK